MNQSKPGFHPEENNSVRMDLKSVSKGTASVPLGMTKVGSLIVKPPVGCSVYTRSLYWKLWLLFHGVGGGGCEARLPKERDILPCILGKV